MAYRELHISWELPSQAIPSDALLLSFLPPREEEKLMRTYYGRVLIGRSEVNLHREKARFLYTDMVARIGATPCGGKTLRQVLAVLDAGNPWWYHKFTNKDVEKDTTFSTILQIVAISNIAKREKIETLVMHGSHGKIGAVMSCLYQTKGKKNRIDWSMHLLKGILSRLKYHFLSLYEQISLSHYISLPEIKPEVVFQGFWDWSIKFDASNKKLEDMYFKSLPEHLSAKGITCAWLLWFSPHTKPNDKRRPMGRVLESAQKHPQLIFLQKFLKIRDILFATLDFRPLVKYLCFSRSEEFRALFREQGLDFWPLLKGRLLYHFCDSSLVNFALVEKSCRRAFAAYKPKLAITFLEMFLYSRAFYQGGRLGNPAVIHCTMQHASYNREKMFLVLDSHKEYQGHPDGYPIPAPDYFFAMGELGKEIFLEAGFPLKRIFLTGSARYDYIKKYTVDHSRKTVRSPLNVLLVTTLTTDVELEMVQAVSFATEGLDGMKLYIRSHPFARMENLPGFQSYRHRITSAHGTLDDDLSMADLVLFTYSTVAEEAVLRGIPVWQWVPVSFDGSVFQDLKVIPRFHTVVDLKRSLKKFISDPIPFLPTDEAINIVLRKCFFAADGMAAERIADTIKFQLLENTKPCRVGSGSIMKDRC